MTEQKTDETQAPTYEHAIPVTIEASLLVYSNKPRLTADEMNRVTDEAAIIIGDDVMQIGSHRLACELLGPDPRGQVMTYETEAGDYDQYPYPKGTECADRVERVTPAMAAADDMLAALRVAADNLDEAIRVHIYGDDETPDADANSVLALAQVRAAIAKAEGKAND